MKRVERQSMVDETISQLIQRVPILAPHDTVRRVVGLMRESKASRLFVQRDGHIDGSVAERALAELLSQRGNADEVLDSAIDSLVEPHIVLINSQVRAQDAARVFAETGEDVLPVIDNYGSFYGVIHRRDVVGFLTKNLRPPSVGGMATPLGVYLTTGSVTGGAGNLGLFLTGVSMAIMMLIAQGVVFGLGKLVEMITRLPIDVYLASTPIALQPNIYDLVFYLATGITAVVFLALMRLFPLSGYHAAEHMTVHAIEAGEALTPDTVRRMPRVHPRCGTNLLAAGGVFVILVSNLGGELGVLMALIIVMVGWRAVGGWLQYFVTTKKPTEKQLISGINAGNELIDNYQARLQYQASGFKRIWNMGFLQTLAGMASTLWLIVDVFNIPGF